MEKTSLVEAPLSGFLLLGSFRFGGLGVSGHLRFRAVQGLSYFSFEVQKGRAAGLLHLWNPLATKDLKPRPRKESPEVSENRRCTGAGLGLKA